MMEVGIVTLKNTLDGLLGWVVNNYVTTADPKDTWLYETFFGVKTGNFDFYVELRNILLRDYKNPDKLETRFMYDGSRASLPTIHIHMPSEDGGGFDSISEGLEDRQLVGSNEYAYGYHKTFQATYDLIITGKNSFEIVALYELVKGLFIAGVITMQHHFQMFSYAGNELMANPDIIPYNTFYRAFKVTIKYDQLVRAIDTYPTVNNLLFEGRFLNHESEENNSGDEDPEV